MVVFTGTYEHTLDAKQRLAIPSELRRLLRREVREGEPEPVLYVTPGGDGCVCLYPEAIFKQRADELDASDLDPEELLVYEEWYYSGARPVELDKQGRVRLPGEMLDEAGLGGEVVVLGVKDHMQVRDRTAWAKRREELLARQPGLANPRLAMRRSGPSRGSGE